ncbi:MFS transporter [Herbiconiux flava]|uniref:DHA1 family purine ribonucleoside efflux pump-like MFS transporter n=1 Tax=Herbiconiux flava TaxID=881268 RepID=A0A852SQ93_9MICO|nr:MFS transporter [Herbiconiux flava]NYD70976.1 DHA1 family purine ribonucleoside efflux pump-like MFS transporter [Herbiconiux flava]GLK19061.1 MFS transporter [Herbiconiux flava]
MTSNELASPGTASTATISAPAAGSGTPTAPNTRPSDTGTTPTPTSWLGVVSLGLGVFAIVMAEFLPASLLTRVAADLGVTEGVAGQSVSVTAIVAAIAGLTIPVLLPRVDRRYLMLGLSALAVVSDLLVAIAPSYSVLLIARVLLGISLGGFWALAISITARLVPADRLGRGLTVVNVGVSLATVAAIPLGTWLGELWGWRAVFVLAAVVGVIAVVVQLLVLPSVRSTGAPGFRPLLATLRSRFILLGLLATALIAAGHFTGFTYIRPAATDIGGLDPSQLSLLLVVYGIAVTAGNLVAGPLADKRMRVAVLLFPVLLGAAMITFALAGSTTPGLIAAVAVWGLGFGAVPTTLTTWMARAEPTRLESVGGLQSATFQVAIALGAIIGGLLVDGIGVQTALITGGVSAALGALLLVSLKPRPAAL